MEASMSSCCCPEKPDDGTYANRCPRSGSVGKAVDRQTVKALLTEPALGRLAPGEYRFCPEANCEVVYFGGDAARFTTGDVRVGVWQKQPFGQRQVCYCFGESEETIRAEIETNGHSSAVGRIREHIAARRCACDIRNPRGACCLGDVTAAVERVATALAAASEASATTTLKADSHDGD
jgi:hypothetical protein